MAETKKKTRQAIDWGAVEPHYRAGIRPLKDIGKEFGCSDAAIVKHAEKNGWTRDLKAKIAARAAAKVSAAAVSAEVSEQRRANQEQVVEANANMQATVQLLIREDVQRTRGLFLRLLEELEVASTPEGVDLIETLHEIVNNPVEADDDPHGAARAERARDQLQKALSVQGRVQSAKLLTDMLEKLVKLARQAHGIDDDNRGGSEIDRLLAKVHNSGD